MISITMIDSGIAQTVYEIQHAAFLPLLQKYQDFDTNPAMETVDKIREKMERANTDSYVFMKDKKAVGWVRIGKLGNGVFRVAALSVLPEYQGQKIAQTALRMIEKRYPEAKKWVLDTILQEAGNVHLYEKLGYRKTGGIEHINESMDLIQFEK